MESRGALEGLADLARREAERDGLQARLESADRHLADAVRRHEEAQVALAAEATDVEKLESFSVTRILAGLRGTRDMDLSREQAEVQAAQYAVAEADARRASAQREVDDLVGRLGAFDDLEELRAELLDRREQEIAAEPAAAATHERLTEMARREGALVAELEQLEEALEAADQAQWALGQAARHLGTAGDWATYDTFFGGGVFGDLAKHRRLDEAGSLMRAADAALRHLATELADVEVDAVGEVGVTELARTFDVWFDNFFSDWAVMERIREAARRVNGLSGGVAAVIEELTARSDDVGTALEELDADRRSVLTS